MLTITRILVGKFFELVRREEGVTAIEYGLIAALIAVAIIAGISFLGTELNNTFDYVGDEVHVQ